MKDNQFSVTCWYLCCSQTTVTLPDGLGWADIESWYVKWNSFFYQIKGQDAFQELPLDDVSIEDLDCKRPSSVEIEEVDEDGFSTGVPI